MEEKRRKRKDILNSKSKVLKLKHKLKQKQAGTGIRMVGEFARVDISRAHRTGIPEIILAEGKEVNEVAEIAIALTTEHDFALISRVQTDSIAEEMVSRLRAEGFVVEYNRLAKMILVRREGYESPTHGRVGLIAAGTADIPVAEEARMVAEACGCEVLRAYDVGIAGIHRLMEPLEQFIEANVGVIIVVAGMEGALPSVVASLVDVPVIGVPTSVGYGLGGKGLGALISMLQSCSPGVAVVNIDNGVGAGAIAARCVMHSHRVAMGEGEAEVEAQAQAQEHHTTSATAIEANLGYSFSDRGLLMRALTRKAYALEKGSKDQDQEIFRTLGDAVLKAILVDLLINSGCKTREELTNKKKALERKESLAELGRELGIGDFILLGTGERKQRANEEPYVLAETLEAVIGAIYLDGGYESARETVAKWFKLKL